MLPSGDELPLGKEEVGSSNLLESLGFSPLKLAKFIGVAVKIAVNFRGLGFTANCYMTGR